LSSANLALRPLRQFFKREFWGQEFKHFLPHCNDFCREIRTRPENHLWSLPSIRARFWAQERPFNPHTAGSGIHPGGTQGSFMGHLHFSLEEDSPLR
jgi:hypothetical protein